MFALITTIIILYLKLNIGKWEVSAFTKLMVNVPFSIYLGWLSVACIANAAAWLKAVQWGCWGMNEHLWMIIILIIATALAITVVFIKKDIFYGMVFIWALSGIFFRLQYIETGSNVVVRVAILISSAFILASVLIKLFKKQIYS